MTLRSRLALVSTTAVAVAVRGNWLMAAISPKISPGMR